MGMHFMVLAKLNMTTGGHSSGLAPVVASLVWPFILKLSFGLRPLQQTSTNLLHASRLFFFQLSQIVFNAESNQSQGSRFERAVRLVYQRFARTTRPSPPDSDEDEDSLHTLSMIAL
ncbi:hypothetical protein Acr_25g0009290 [Actinidia rufa]|uniref:Uncharacterized protein n=1 Tax=Actinidia rufa TaxID=165716 RepID=A0A7J0H0C0_9ERIC|nr:hypothetical protein Acr_25g0009290 [Actinidia rufa]